MVLSKRSAFASNPIEEEDILAAKLRSKGRKIYALNRGDPVKYFPTPKYILDAFKEAVSEGMTSYSAADGTKELKDAIAKRYSSKYRLPLDDEDIIVTAGVSEALMFLSSAMVDQSDSAILFRPYYPLYERFLRMNGGKPIMERYDEKDSWNVHIESLGRTLNAARKAGKIRRIKYMILTNPNNPTGTVLRRNVLEEVVDLANEHGILLVSDEIYDEIIFGRQKFTSISEVAKGTRYMVLNGMSKIYDSTGMRIGFALLPSDDRTSKELKAKLRDYAQARLSVCTPAQHAAAVAMNNKAEHRKAIRRMVSSIGEQARYAVKLLSENEHLSTVEPNGAFYILPRIDLKGLGMRDDRQFAERLLKEEGIQITRGSGFGAQSHFRIVALPPKEILGYAINRINAFCETHSK